ncbi:YeiH family protein [Polaromonas sp. AER18D-145]|uniref:YeiH family protein n=1 Tax=Polaromonas sp. AER18D-145 TaxID=1977060 RepID=UPI001F0B03C6|nr:putative sulfate exporter family transporter [Polaromonas sp. AER18D-145]
MRALMLRVMHLAGWQAQALRTGTMLPGGMICVLIALAASHAAGLHGGPPMLYALLFGTALHYLSHEIRTAPGVQACGSTVLRLGVGLLGARITFGQIADLGWTTALLLTGAVATTLLCGLLLARRLGLSRSLGVLAGGATAICGASAALAIAAVLPRNEAVERDTLAVVVLATLLSTLAMLLYPLIASALALPPALAGLFIGGTIHDVAQVIVAGYALGPETGDAASIIKLLRVSLLPLAVLVISVAVRKAAPRAPVGIARPAALIPGFLLLFLILMVLNSMGWLSPTAQSALNEGSRSCLMVGVAALGMKTSFIHLARSGWQQAFLMVATTTWIGLFVLFAVMLLRDGWL